MGLFAFLSVGLPTREVRHVVRIRRALGSAKKVIARA